MSMHCSCPSTPHTCPHALTLAIASFVNCHALCHCVLTLLLPLYTLYSDPLVALCPYTPCTLAPSQPLHPHSPCTLSPLVPFLYSWVVSLLVPFRLIEVRQFRRRPIYIQMLSIIFSFNMLLAILDYSQNRHNCNANNRLPPNVAHLLNET